MLKQFIFSLCWFYFWFEWPYVGSQARGEQLLTRYIQRWAKDFLRHRLDWTVDEESGNPMDPRHLSSALCPCQYIEEYIKNKPRSDHRAFCPCCASWLIERGID